MSALGSEKKLARSVGREYGLALGNATTGLYCAMRAAGLRGARIAVPYNVCLNVVLAVLFSENLPVFVDIEPETNGMDPSQLRLVAQQVRGVIAVHAYGAVCNIAAIRNICSEHALFLVEDCAQAIGARSPHNPVGRDGSVSVFSFGKGKIVDAGHGGAVVMDDARLFREIRQVAERLDQASDEKRERIAEFNDLHTMLYNRFWGHNVSRFSFVFRTLAPELKDAFLQKFDESYDRTILNALERLPQNIDERRQKAEIFKAHCRSKGIVFFDPPDGSVYWRFNIYIKKDRDKLLRTLLSQNFKVSSWYPSVDQFFYETGDSKGRALRADCIGEEILNLWVNGEVPETYCHEIMERIESFLEQTPRELFAGRNDALSR